MGNKGADKHTHENYVIDSVQSLRPCEQFEHEHERAHRNGDDLHYHILTREPDGSVSAVGVKVQGFRGAELDAELLRRATVAYPEFGRLIADIERLGLRSAEAAGVREMLSVQIRALGKMREPLTGADVGQIRVGTFERVGF